MLSKKKELEKFLGFSKIVIVEGNKSLILNEGLGVWAEGCWHSTDEFLDDELLDFDEEKNFPYFSYLLFSDIIPRLRKIARDPRIPLDISMEIQEIAENLEI